MTTKARLSLLLLPLLALPAAALAQTINIDESVLGDDSGSEEVSRGDRLGQAIDGWDTDLSDAEISAEELAAASDPDAPPPTPKLEFGLVSTANEDASYAGQQILMNGGNSVDAALAVMLALTVVEPQSSGIGGGGFLLHEDAATGTLSSIDGRETAPVAAKPQRFLNADGTAMPFAQAFPGGLSVGVPGNIALMAMAHQKWGKAEWRDLFTPAIQLAEGGFTVNASLAKRLEEAAPLWSQYPEAQKLFWIDGRPAREGDELTNPALAQTLQRIADIGPNAFYAGPTGDAIVRAVTRAPVNRGDMSNLDLAAYRAKERPPVCIAYRTYEICGMGPPSSGATTSLQILELLEPFDLKALGPDSAESWYLIGQAMQLAYADRAAYLGDPDFVNVPVEGLLDPAYVASRSKLINRKKARTDYSAGTPPMSEPRQPVESGDDDGTSHFVTVDATGNVTSMTSTIEGPFGSQLVAGGFFLNNELTDFSFLPTDATKLDEAGQPLPVANAVAAGKRPLSSMSPTIVYDADGKPVMALGSAGGRRIIMHVAKTLIGAIDFGLPLEEAMALPNIYYTEGKLLVEQGAMAPELVQAIGAFGQPVEATDLPSKLNGAQWTPTFGWEGAVDPRSEGVALSQ